MLVYRGQCARTGATVYYTQGKDGRRFIPNAEFARWRKIRPIPWKFRVNLN